SHELMEAATDPYPYPQNPGYADLTGDPFELSGLSAEVSDWCATEAPILLGGEWMSRVWSNQIAAQGRGDPCLPGPDGTIYYNVSIEPAGDVVVDSSTTDQTVTFTITGWSTAEISDWTLDLWVSGISTFMPKSLGFDGTKMMRRQINNGQSATFDVV